MLNRFSMLFTLLLALVALGNGFVPVQPAANAMSTALSVHHVKVKIAVGDGEPIESALRRFKREVNKSGHLMELRHRRQFENSQERIKRKVKEARLRKKFERIQRRRMSQQT
eukprot:CAMPEP_0198136988 /NCGR_PEP_ID=MMETSP1443-20131203/534_1 /TAXON_ID=186043 /ORGANISM="Entomoneis sp., Strain CCMP2396" /LENGTH=111 /DNA_ID=CAMNT_0043798299 /DNA_START=78 /DNA_END=413 /DNA_ORIENTATION=-